MIIYLKIKIRVKSKNFLYLNRIINSSILTKQQLIKLKKNVKNMNWIFNKKNYFFH